MVMPWRQKSAGGESLGAHTKTSVATLRSSPSHGKPRRSRMTKSLGSLAEGKVSQIGRRRSSFHRSSSTVRGTGEAGWSETGDQSEWKCWRVLHNGAKNNLATSFREAGVPCTRLISDEEQLGEQVITVG